MVNQLQPKTYYFDTAQYSFMNLPGSFQYGLISEEVRNHQFRFKELIDPETHRPLLTLEHEVRSLHHPMFNRSMVNRDANESARRYRRGRDALIPFICPIGLQGARVRFALPPYLHWEQE